MLPQKIIKEAEAKIIWGRSKDDYLIYRKGSGNTVEILDIQVASINRRKGIGKRMLYDLMDRTIGPDIRMVWAITRTTNLIAQEFYENLRFRVVGVCRNFYQDDGANAVDAIIYGRDIPPKEVASL